MSSELTWAVQSLASAARGAVIATVRGSGIAAARGGAVIAIAALVQACSSGSLGSDVDENPAIAPTARAQLVNGGTTGTFREGAEVLLTGKASEDGDGPLIAWTWRQTAGPAVRLIEGNSTSVSFTAPDVSAPTVLTFALTVEDSTFDTDEAAIDVTVVPAQDADKFLSLDVRTGSTFDGFRVVAALAGGAATGAQPKPFTVSARAWLVYPPRSAPGTDCGFDPLEFAQGVPESIASGCVVEPLADLIPDALPGGGTGWADAWPAGIVAPDEDAKARISRWWNPRFVLAIPRLDVREFNQRFVDSGERERLLDGHVAHKARIVLDLALTAPENQQDAALILTDLTGAAIELPPQVFAHAVPAGVEIIENDGTGLPTTALLPLEAVLSDIAGREGALTSEVYYRTVDPAGTRTTLNAWLEQAGFASDGNGTLRPEALAGSGEFAHAVYVNNFDLGFGRRMFARTDDLGNVFSFVKNYSTLEGAIRDLDSFVTVVMEYSPLASHTAPTPKFVKFFTYIDDGSGNQRRVATFDFDGRGERATPGNCTSCHGGSKPPGVAELVFDAGCGNPTDSLCYAWPAVNRERQPIADGNLNAMFLPWDLDSLLYADTDPAIVDAPVPSDGVTLAAELLRDYGDYSRSRQDAQLKKLNQATYDTYQDTARTNAARELIESWYGGADQTGALLSTFDGSATPGGWENDALVPDPAAPGMLIANPSDAADLYHGVYARFCRMCHANMLDETLRFDTYREFIVLEPATSRLVFAAGVMPAARLTMDRFWSPFSPGPVPGELLAAHLATVLDAEPASPPAAAAGIAGLSPVPNRGDTVYLDGGPSHFAASYAWSLSAPADSAATLVGAGTRQPTFVTDVPGTYELALTVNSGTEAEATIVASEAVPNRLPAAVDDLYALDLVASSTLAGSVLAGPHQDADADGDALAASLVTMPAAGTVTLGADGAFVYTFTGNPASPPASDAFGYRIEDGFGGAAAGTVTVLLNAAPAAERPTAPVSLAASDASTAAQDASTFGVSLTWLASSDDTSVAGYNVYRNGRFLELVASAAPPGATVTHVDATAEPDTTYTYRVTAVDADHESALSNDDTVTVMPSLRRNIQTGWGAGTESLWAASRCIGCHRGAPGGLTLSGDASQVFTELTEDAAAPAPYRVDPLDTEASLLLCKPITQIVPAGCPHGGGDFLQASSPQYQMLRRWIGVGAPDN
jgi:hypothetical protein